MIQCVIWYFNSHMIKCCNNHNDTEYRDNKISKNNRKKTYGNA